MKDSTDTEICVDPDSEALDQDLPVPACPWCGGTASTVGLPDHTLGLQAWECDDVVAPCSPFYTVLQ